MKSKPKVSIVMGSKSDYPTMKFCEDILKKLKVNLKQILFLHTELLTECLNLLISRR